MWPWNKKKSSDNNKNLTISDDPSESTPVVTKNISIKDIEDSIVKVRSKGAHFCSIYARMNGYDEKLTNPSRFSEIVGLINDEPNFSESSISFAVKCELEELNNIASRPEGLSYGIPSIESKFISSLQFEEDENKSARQILNEVQKIGCGDISKGFSEVGFDLREFLQSTVIRMREEELSAITRKVEEKKNVLRPIFLRAYSSGRNKYGEMEYGPLFKEINDFYNHFFPEGTLKFFFFSPPLLHVAKIAIEWAHEARVDDEQPSDGIDFEHWCAEKIEGQGWSVVVSKASGDQGVDIIASTESITVAVQCKRYTSPVGNKAVQEAFSGAKHFNADLAVVIGTGGFTSSAKSLASTTNVILLDSEMIGDFTEQVINKISEEQ